MDRELKRIIARVRSDTTSDASEVALNAAEVLHERFSWTVTESKRIRPVLAGKIVSIIRVVGS